MPTLEPTLVAPPRRRHRSYQRWTWFGLLVAGIVCLPLLAVLWLALFPAENIWPHLYATVLPGYISTTLWLMLGVAVGTILIGVSAAWLVTHYTFPGRNLFTWALLLPFAVPAYVLAYVYTDLLEFAGPVQSLLRSWFGWQSARDYWFPPIRSLGGATLMLVMVLYPYVYLLARAAFLEQSASVLEVAQVLGGKKHARFFRVALPMARPAIIVGVSMALMETLNDFGTIDYFAVKTLTAGVYDVWLQMNNLGGGAQIACLLLVFVMLCLALERGSRRRQQLYQPAGSRFRSMPRTRLHNVRAIAASLFCLLPVTLGFVIPAVVLLRYAISHFATSWTPEFQLSALHSISLSLAAALLTVIVAVVMSYSYRLNGGLWLKQALRLSTLGYAIPGAVLALGVMIPLAAFDNGLDALLRQYVGISTGLLLSGSVFALLFAYCVRFLAVSLGSVESSLQKISPSMDEAARSLGKSPLTILRKVHLPLMRGGILTAALVVFVDTMKELPATLVLRPFNFDTLATQVYQFASDELIEQAALGSLLIVITGLLPVILLSITIDRSRR